MKLQKKQNIKSGLLKSLILLFLLTAGTTSRAELPIPPHWSGDVILNSNIKVKIQLNFAETSPGKYSVTLDSPEQGVKGIPGVVNSLSASGFSISVPKISLSFSGKIFDSDGIKKCSGTFRQVTIKLPLVLSAVETKVVRTQTPEPPFPYITKEVSFENPSGNAVLKGTLTLPSSYYEGTPIALLVSGSGLQNRDEEIFDHKPFAVIADYLAKIGIGTLRYDDRGFGESTGDGENATTADFASDAAAGIKYLRDIEKFNKVGVIGHSEGASIAFMLSNSEVKPDFIVGIGTPAVKGERILKEQLARSLGQTGAQTSISNLRQQGNPWILYFLDYDPSEDIRSASCPVLVIYGEKDTQVSPALNFEAFKTLLPEATVIVYPELNHLMQHAKTGNADEYYQIEETFSPEVLSEIGKFIQKNR